MMADLREGELKAWSVPSNPKGEGTGRPALWLRVSGDVGRQAAGMFIVASLAVYGHCLSPSIWGSLF